MNSTSEHYWKIYFPQQPFEEHSFEATLINKLIAKLKDHFSSELGETMKHIPIDYHQLCLELPDADSFRTFLHENPDSALRCLSCSIHMLAQNRSLDPVYTVALYNYEPRLNVRQLKARHWNRFVSVRGTVVRVGNFKPLVLQMTYRCPSCGKHQVFTFADGYCSLPRSCPSPSCRNVFFEPVHSSAVLINYQNVKIQEELDQKETGRVPRSIDCDLKGDLVDSCKPGDTVTVCGIVKSMAVEPGRNDRGGVSNLCVLYIDINSVDTQYLDTHGRRDIMEFSEKELLAINFIHSQGNLFNLLVNSLCPDIYGLSLLKAGMTLALFGGCDSRAKGKKVSIRRSIHLLCVGDPGLGKSQVLHSVSQVSPRGTYICGTNSTSTGLTVTLSKEKGSSDFGIDAGALVLSDEGCCCIDEFDKMGTYEHQSLLEAMEQQSISIAKAGIICNLSARSSVIAAANPCGGHYNKGKTVAENLKLNNALLSRFDLIFILIDRPDLIKDNLLARHILELHQESIKKNDPIPPLVSTGEKPTVDNNVNLLNLLKVPPNFDPLPKGLLRKYIGYAKKYVHPKLTSEAASALKQFYLELRDAFHSPDYSPVTARQLESLIRLSEARAKAELRETVYIQDALDVIELMKASLCDGLGISFTNTPHGFVVDFSSQQRLKTKSISNRLKLEVVDYLHRYSKENSHQTIFTFKELAEILENGRFQVNNIPELISSLNFQGYLLKHGTQKYKLTTI